MDNALLNKLYHDLDYQRGSLFTASESPDPDMNATDWLEKGEWLAAAKRAGADKLFFVDNNPVAVFAQCGISEIEKARAFNNVWCLGRPRLLFLASIGEILVLDLAEKPIYLPNKSNSDNNINSKLKTLARVTSVGKIAQELQTFHRDCLESGRVFGDSMFGDIENRADKALIRDLKTVRSELIVAGLSNHKLQFAHSLIGRSIFIRYLEDRGILTYKYFMNLVGDNHEWESILDQPSIRIGLDLSERRSMYARVLSDKDFTYTLFRALAADFNGDIFPGVDEEERHVEQKHLDLLQDLIYGDAGMQMQLFFKTYHFEIVPLDLISSIYEEFYNPSTRDIEKRNNARMDGVFYTPAILAELMASRILTEKELSHKPRILDPSCGSGIFLVEAFRRIVRYEWYKHNNRPSFDSLKLILKNQIAGIEINEEAARITAFSLCLALLHYLSPPDISDQIELGNKLPNLLVSSEISNNFYQCILVGNTFDTEIIKTNKNWNNKFGNDCIDIIISNPPWGNLKKSSDQEIVVQHDIALKWCYNNQKIISNFEFSEAFLWRYLSILHDNGKAAVLIPLEVLLKSSPKSQEFRKLWMAEARIKEVFNFAHVRKFFFHDAIAPFAMIIFEKSKSSKDPVIYCSAKRVTAFMKTQAILLTKYDYKILRNEALDSNELWKIYWYGRLQDRSLIKWMQTKKRLNEYVDQKNSGRGYQNPSQNKNNNDAIKYQSFKSLLKLESRYDTPIFTQPPLTMHRLGAESAYKGMRVLVNEGISQKSPNEGYIIAQFSKARFCFYRSVYGLKLKEQIEARYKVLTGILWSSLARYYFFMTTSNWGIWHDKILENELLKLPVVFDDESIATKKIIDIVDLLRNYQPQERSITHLNGVDQHVIMKQRSVWERKLDDAVYDLYILSEEQKDLIRDFCEITLPFIYNSLNSFGSDNVVLNNDYSWIKDNYINVFSRCWNAFLDDNTEIRAHMYMGANDTMVALEFFPADNTDEWDLANHDKSLEYAINKIMNSLNYPVDVSQMIIDGVAHIVSSDSILIVKRNEKRFWTRSLAREDADITICKHLNGAVSEHRGDF